MDSLRKHLPRTKLALVSSCAAIGWIIAYCIQTRFRWRGVLSAAIAAAMFGLLGALSGVLVGYMIAELLRIRLVHHLRRALLALVGYMIVGLLRVRPLHHLRHPLLALVDYVIARLLRSPQGVEEIRRRIRSPIQVANPRAEREPKRGSARRRTDAGGRGRGQ